MSAHRTHQISRRVRTILCAGAAVAVASFANAATAAVGLPRLSEVQVFAIDYGANEVPAFTRDGSAALVVRVHRENGNAHSTDWVLVAVRARTPVPGVAGIPQEVVRDEVGAEASALFRIEPFDGENELSALQLVRATIDGQSETLMLEARREVGGVPSLTSPTRAVLRVWRLEGPGDEIGRTPYRFVLVGTATTDRSYCNATTALHKELGVPYPDGWDNEDTVDGCMPTAASHRLQAALEMERTLDITSFPNSIGPRHLPAGTNFAAAGFGAVEAFPDGWVQIRKGDASWQFSLLVMEDSPDHKLLCIGDQVLDGGTYRSMQAIDVRPDGAGHWSATGKPHPVTGCSQ